MRSDDVVAGVGVAILPRLCYCRCCCCCCQLRQLLLLRLHELEMLLFLCWHLVHKFLKVSEHTHMFIHTHTHTYIYNIANY